MRYTTQCLAVRAGQLACAGHVQDKVQLVCRSHQQIQLERRKVLMLQQQLEQLTSKLGTTRSAMGSVFSAKEKTQALQKQIKILENRLEKQYIKYNEVAAGISRPTLYGCSVVCPCYAFATLMGAGRVWVLGVDGRDWGVGRSVGRQLIGSYGRCVCWCISGWHTMCASSGSWNPVRSLWQQQTLWVQLAKSGI
jgi:ribosome biogenesis protein Nip4